jgi:hypothetical protein
MPCRTADGAAAAFIPRPEVSMPTTPRGVVAILCLGFTLVVAASSSRADDSRAPLGAVMRGGTVVGRSSFADADYTTLGGAVAAGLRAGRIGAELEYDYLTLQSDAPASVILGDAHRVAVNGRLDVLRFPGWLGSAASMAIWAELGVGRQWTSWRAGAVDRREVAALGSRMSTLAASPSRLDTTAGFGWRLDHPASQVRGWPRRIGWVLGWTRPTGRRWSPRCPPSSPRRSPSASSSSRPGATARGWR